jgi:hypothetical protein
MECCSPDVGDCQKCHPELWIQKGGSVCNWIPKVLGKQKKTRFNRKGNRPSRPQVTRKVRR